MFKKANLIFLFWVVVNFVYGCGTTSTPKVEAVTTSIVVEPEPSEVEVSPATEPEKEESTREVVSSNLEKLREFVEQGREEEATQMAHQILEQTPESLECLEALRTLSQYAIASGNEGLARLYIENALSRSPEDIASLEILSRIAQSQQRDEEAIRILDKILSLDAKHVTSLVRKSALLLKYLDDERALESAKTAHQIAPDRCDVRILYADSLYAHRDYREAVSEYELAEAKSCPMSTSALENMAKIYEVHLQMAERACAMYRRLFELDRENPYYKASMDYQCGQSK